MLHDADGVLHATPLACIERVDYRTARVRIGGATFILHAWPDGAGLDITSNLPDPLLVQLYRQKALSHPSEI